MWHRKQKECAETSPTGPRSAMSPQWTGWGRSPSLALDGGPVRRRRDVPWTRPQGGREDGRTGNTTGRPCRAPLALSGQVPAVSTSTSGGRGPERWGPPFHPPGPCLQPPEQGRDGQQVESNQNTCLRVSRGWERRSSSLARVRELTGGRGKRWGWGSHNCCP